MDITNQIIISVYGRTDMGRVRKNNEDSIAVADVEYGFVIDPPILDRYPVGEQGLLLAVSDGMGGANAGEVASRLALNTLVDRMKEYERDAPPGAKERKFQTVVEEINQLVWQQAQMRPEWAGMGATLTSVLLCNYGAIIAQVGDSRAYFIRGGQIKQVTKDQSWTGVMMAAGLLSEEEATTSSYRNIILQAIGSKEHVQVALDYAEFRLGDYVLLCSDGLSNKVRPAEMLAAIHAEEDLESAVNYLVDLANERGGEDNVSIILAQVGGDLPQFKPGETLTKTLQPIKGFDPFKH